MAEPIETISYVARRLIQFEKKFAEAELTRRQTNASILRKISRHLITLEQLLYRNDLAIDTCRELAVCATQLAISTQEEVGEAEAQKLSEALEAACHAEKLIRQYRESEQAEFLSSEVLKAAILTRALADGIFIEDNGTEEMPQIS